MIAAISKCNMDTDLRAREKQGMIQTTHSRLSNFRIYCSLKLYFNYPSFN